MRTHQPASQAVTFTLNVSPEQSELANGLTLYHIPVDASRLVRIEFMFHGGQWLQDSPLQASMAFKLLKEGSALYEGEKVADFLDYYGATVSVRTNMSYSLLSLTCLQRHVAKVLPIVMDMLQSPLYADDKLRIALAQSRKAYEVGLQTVGERCKQLFYKSIYGQEHPMSQFPSMTDYDTLSSDDLRRYKDKYINFQNCTLWVSGNLDAASLREITSIVEQCDLSSGERFEDYALPPSHQPEQKRFFHEMAEPTVQSCVRVGSLLLPRRHPDYVPMTVLSTLFGGYFGSRLMMNIRERKGYTYDIRSVIYQLPHQTAFIITSETANQYVEAVISEIYSEMQRLIDTPVDTHELDIVRRYMLGNLCRNYEGGLSLASRLMRLHTYGLTLADVTHEADTILSVHPSDIQTLAEKYLQPDAMIECIAGSK